MWLWVAALAALLVATPAGAQTLRTQASVPADSFAVPGSELTVYLMTMGQGDAVWERYGHNAIGIRDARRHTDIVYNWGTFDFEASDFLTRFIRGDMRYWIQPTQTGPTIQAYIQRNRTVTIQVLNFSPAQRLAMRQFVEWNARDENKYYRYDYFRDNCSTRVRDALDRVLGGVIRQETDTIFTAQSWRDHALRLMAPDFWLSLGVNIGLGRPADQHITAWQEMFIPMRLRDRLRTIRVPDETGRLVPLVTSERQVFVAQRPPADERPPTRAPWFFLAGLLVAALLWYLARPAPGGGVSHRTMAVALIVVWGVIVGILGGALLFLRFGTQHEFAWDNSNLFFYNPLWFALAIVLLLPRRIGGMAAGALLAARAGAALAVLGLLLWLVPFFHQDSLAVMLLVAPMSVAIAWLMPGLVAAPSGGAPDAGPNDAPEFSADVD